MSPEEHQIAFAVLCSRFEAALIHLARLTPEMARKVVQSSAVVSVSTAKYEAAKAASDADAFLEKLTGTKL